MFLTEVDDAFRFSFSRLDIPMKTFGLLVREERGVVIGFLPLGHIVSLCTTLELTLLK
jgi:hypothetical protein